MLNIVRVNQRQAGVPYLDPIADALQRGWTDYANGRGFPEAYDTWPQHEQVNYENGRRLAALISTSGAVPKWARNQKCPTSKSIHPSCLDAWNAECRFIRNSYVER